MIDQNVGWQLQALSSQLRKNFFSGFYLLYRNVVVSLCQISQVMTDLRKTIFRFTNNNEV